MLSQLEVIQMFSSERERETLAQCEAVLVKLAELESAIRSGPTLTRDENHHFRDWCRRMKFRYGDIADHCRRNLKGV